MLRLFLVLRLSQLPILKGAMDLAKAGNKTRASATNRSFLASTVRVEADADSILTELAFDAQTSGGLLISVAEDRAGELIERAQSAGAESACIVGHVEQKQDVSIILRQ